KGRIAAPFDHFLVWSDHMRSELLTYYPHLNATQVHVVGTPQFDPYADTGLLWSRSEFFNRIGADASRPLICYSGGDAGLCPDEHNYVDGLLNLIRSGRILARPQVLLRPSPADLGTRYEAVRRRYPELIYAAPNWVHTDPGNWARSLPSPQDV